MLRFLLLAALPTALLTATDVHAQSSTGAPSARTTRFIAKAAATDAFERDAGQLAEKRSQNADVREFGAMMSRVHADTTAKLLAVLDKDRLPKPSKSPNPDPNQAKLLTDLVHATKGQFDRAYAHSQVVVHQQALALMQEYAAAGDNPDLKQLAKDTEPVVQRHLDMAQKLEAQLGGPPKALGRKED
jgi:putative membrane protein